MYYVIMSPTQLLLHTTQTLELYTAPFPTYILYYFDISNIYYGRYIMKFNLLTRTRHDIITAILPQTHIPISRLQHLTPHRRSAHHYYTYIIQCTTLALDFDSRYTLAPHSPHPHLNTTTMKLREMGEMKQNYILHTFGFFMICDNKQQCLVHLIRIKYYSTHLIYTIYQFFGCN